MAKDQARANKVPKVDATLVVGLTMTVSAQTKARDQQEAKRSR